MKTNITISIDVEIAEQLKREKNYSDVINELAKDYYDDKNTENLQKLSKKLVEIERNAKDIKKLKKETILKIKKIKEKETRILKIYQNIPDDIIKELRNYPKMGVNELYLRHKELYSKRCSWIDLKKAFIEMKGGID